VFLRALAPRLRLSRPVGVQGASSRGKLSANQRRGSRRAISCHRNDAPRAFKEQTWRQTSSSHQIVFVVRVDFMKARCAALLLVTLSLGGCCLSGSGCNAPMATTTSNWDGLGQPPAEASPPPAPTQRVATRTKGQGEPGRVHNNSNTGDDFEDDDARLKRKLIICQGCAMSGN
jgi:hypothetical protein